MGLTWMAHLSFTSRITAIDALEILDSRGNPTLRVTVNVDTGHGGVASVPSGASTGRWEAVELRDGDAARYSGKGMQHAVSNVRDLIGPHLKGFDPCLQAKIDKSLIELDGTNDKSRLGANAILGVSMAVARAAANAQSIPLYIHLAGNKPSLLPVPMMNIVNGGLHAENFLDFQEFMIVPHGACSFSEALRYGSETFHALRAALRKRGYSVAVGDEGGFAPDLQSSEEACDLILEAVSATGLIPGRDVALALDPAATSFWDGRRRRYCLSKSKGGVVPSADLLALYARLVDAYPIVSIEDGFAEDDWDGFQAHTAMLGKRIQIVGDDLYATNPDLIRKGIETRATNAALIKLNQVGTVSETVQAIEICRAAGWRYVISHRSGETEDTFIADFAVAMGGGQIKAGSLSRSERLAKYNRLLEIEHELGTSARYESPFQAQSTADEAGASGGTTNSLARRLRRLD
jgi:enolase